MKISVVIPAYNAASVIAATMESVLAQTAVPDEILVLDDGSTDDTYARLQDYQGRVVVDRQSNRGVANARNTLCERATGEEIAFMDAGDIWHPNYLEVQSKALQTHPEAIATFAGHVTFEGLGGYTWTDGATAGLPNFEVIPPLTFLDRYNRCPGPFGSPTFFCIRTKVLARMGAEPFPAAVSGADDFYLMNMLPFHGPVLYTETPLAAYRVTPGSISSNRLKNTGLGVNAFEMLAEKYSRHPEAAYLKVFCRAFASKRRHYAKLLMGAGLARAARRQLKFSLLNGGGIISAAKSLGIWLSTYVPGPFAPCWPASQRDARLT